MFRFVFLISFALTSQVKANVSVFVFNNNFDFKTCKLPVRSKTELPTVFTTVLGDSGGKEFASEKAVSDYRRYFMSLSSNARISDTHAQLTRDEIVKISKQKKLQWDSEWKKINITIYFLLPQLQFLFL